MDSITQAALGAAVGEAILGPRAGAKGAIVGAVIATLPDLDVLLYLVYDSYDMLRIHRGISHSVIFNIIVAFPVAFLLSRTKWFRGISYRRLLLFAGLCLLTHILLDTFTAYGTQLLLPFSDHRLGLDSINVVDPLYTVPLLVGLLLSVWRYRNSPGRPIYNRWGLIISSLYLASTLVTKQVATKAISSHFSDQNIAFQELLTMPVKIGSIYWYGVAKSEDSIYLQKYTLLAGPEGPTEAFPIQDELLSTVDADMAETMRWFAKGFYTVELVEDQVRVYNLQVDMRGVVQLDGRKAPTAGYFEIGEENGRLVFSSGSVY